MLAEANALLNAVAGGNAAPSVARTVEEQIDELKVRALGAQICERWDLML